MPQQNKTFTFKLVVDTGSGIAAITNFNKVLGQTDAQMQRTASHAANLNNAFAPLHRTLLGLAGGYLFSKIAKSFLQFGQESELIMMRFEGVLKSEKEAIGLYDELQKFALKSPAQLFELTEAAAMLGPIMKGGRKEILAWMPVISDLAAYAKISVGVATEQVIKMFSSGAQSARLFRLHGVLEMLGFHANVRYTAEETKLQLFRKWSEQDSFFRGMSDRMMQTWKGQSSNFMDYVGRFQRYFMGVGEQGEGLLKSMTGWMKKINDELQRMDESGELKERAQNLADGFKHLLDILGKLALWFTEHPDTIKNAINIMFGVMILNTVGKFVGSINNIGIAFATLHKTILRTSIGQAIATSLTAALPMLNAIAGPLAIIGAVVGGIAIIKSLNNSQKILDQSTATMEKVRALEAEARKDPAKAAILDQLRKDQGMAEFKARQAASLYENYDPTSDVERRSEDYFLNAQRALAGDKKAILEKEIQDEIDATEKKFITLGEQYQNQYRKELNWEADFERAKIEIRERLTREFYDKEQAEADKIRKEKERKEKKYWDSIAKMIEEEAERQIRIQKAIEEKAEKLRTGKSTAAMMKSQMLTPIGSARGGKGEWARKEFEATYEAENYEEIHGKELADMLKALEDGGLQRADAEAAIEKYIASKKMEILENYYDDRRQFVEKEEERQRKQTLEGWENVFRRTGKAFGDMADLYQQWGEMGAISKKKAFQMNKAFNIAEAIMNTSLGVTSVLGEKLPMWAKVPLIGLVTGLGSAQIGMIAAQQPSFDQGGISSTPGTYWSGVPEAHIPLQGGAVPVRLTGSGGGGSNITILMQNPSFQDANSMNQTMTHIAKTVVERMAPNVVVRDYKNDGPMRKLFMG